MKKILGLLVFSLQLPAADYTTYIGGTSTGLPPAYDVAVNAMSTDASGNTYLTGSLSIDTITSAPSSIAFVTKLGPTGQLVFSKAFGGSVYPFTSESGWHRQFAVEPRRSGQPRHDLGDRDRAVADDRG